jgi:hypothetical protein
VNASGIPVITASGPVTFCQGGSVTLTTSAAASYLWSPGGATTQSISVNTGGSYTVSVTGTCPGTSLPVVVTVNPATAVTLTTGNPVCSTDPVFALTGGVPAGGVYSGTGVSGGNFNPAVAGVGTFIITYTYTNSSGCTGTATSSMIVNNCGGCTSPPAKPGVIAGLVNGLCNQQGITYTIASVATATSYNWTVPSNCTIVSNTGTSITVNFLPGFVSGYLSVSANNACGTSLIRRLYVVSKIVIANNILGPILVCSNQQTAAYSIPPVPGATSYLWSISNGAAIVSSGNTAIADFSHSYGNHIVIKVRVANACGISNYKQLNITVNHDCEGEHEDDNDSRVMFSRSPAAFMIAAYPNPTAGRLTVDITTAEDAPCAINMYDMFGREVIQQRYPIAAGRNSIVLNTDEVVSGIYFLHVEVSGLPVKIIRIAINR